MRRLAKGILPLFRRHWAIGLVLLLGAILRFYRLADMANYDFDQEYATTFALQVIREYPIRYVGQGLSIQGLFMGPWYFYYLVPFYWLFRLSPLGGFVGSVLLGLAIIGAYYFLGRELFSPRAGLLAALLRATSFWAINADWSMVPAFSSDLAVLITWWLFFQLWRGKSNYLIALTFVFGLFTSFHLIHFPLILVFLVLWAVRRWRFTWPQLGLSLIAFIVPAIPLIMFDYWRGWAMVRQMSGFFQFGSTRGGSMDNLPTMIMVVADFLGEILYLPHIAWLRFNLLGLFIFFLWKSVRKDKLFHHWSLGLLLVVTIGYYTFFPTHVPEYYLGAVRALFFLYAAFLFDLLLTKKRLWRWVASGVLIWIFGKNLLLLNRKWQSPNLVTLSAKQAIVKEIIRSASGQPFRVSYIRTLGWDSGFRSLFAVDGVDPGDTGPEYFIVVPKDLRSTEGVDYSVGGVGLLYPH